MKPRTLPLAAALSGLLALALLPTAGAAGQAECGNATTSLASLVNDPTSGDEAFFKLPTGPANVMILMDTSGSMANLPQCGDPGWNNGPIYTDSLGKQYNYCTSPAIAAPPRPVAPLTATVYGTCQPWASASLGVTGNPDLSWMQGIAPSRAYPDPGHPINALGLRDDPPWGTGCVGNACMFDPDAYYFMNDWSINTVTHVSTARRRASETDATLPKACIALDANGTPLRDLNNNTIDLGPACRLCMGTAGSGTDGTGFFMYRVTYQSAAASYTTYPGTTTPAMLIRGTWLNANPPKYVAARKVVKDLAWMDPAAPSKLDQVRQGLTILCSSCGTRQKATLVVPLGPDKAASFPGTQANFVQARQTIIDVVNDKIAGHFDPASTNTPLASALFNVGQYFTTPGLYTNLFGSSYEIASFKETAAGTVNAPWVTKAGAVQCSICWACQQSAVVMVTDGAPNNEITFPAAISGYDTNAYTAAANCGAGGASCFGKDPAPRVASWLHNNDLRTELAMGKSQALSVHTVGFNLLDPLAIQVLKATANMGAGSFQNAKDARSLSDAVFNAINFVVQKQNSFSAASASSLQTVQTASAEALLTRFKPNDTATWEGHLYRGAFFDEFLNGCDPSKPPAQQPTVQCGPKQVSASFNGVTDPATGNAVCTGVYLIDQDCDEVAEDPQTGDFIKKGQATPANFPWDAGAVLSTPGTAAYRSADENAANARTIFTWVNGAKEPFTAANVAKLKPFLNIDPTWCNAFLTQIGIASADPTTECAKQVIYFVRGWDVTDNDLDGCWGPGNPKNATAAPACKSGASGEERDRANDSRKGNLVFWKLGDVFHSSPAVINPPIDEVRCDTGYEKQCVPTLHSPTAYPNQTPIASYAIGGKTVDAYDAWRIANAQRPRVVLVGANDGMLHAFDAGTVDLSKPTDALGNYQFNTGTGTELWAFIPPDLLPRLRYLINSHQYMVDGSVMVRDVWIDANGDGKKQSSEYRTVAIVGERTGGTQYTALDVTVPTAPTFLWSFPPPLSDDARYMAQSWMDFAPRPPPIGPIKLAKAGDPRGFEERWIVAINGGYDPAMTEGRAVWMVDVWTGQVVWRFTDDDFKKTMGFDANTSMFPVAAGLALIDMGDPASASFDSDGFFDTATWGDLGGNLWVARFQEPGVVDASGRVGNWFAARAFEEQRRSDDLQSVAGRNEFFYMTANAFEPTTRTLRTFLGSASREHLMETTATCGSDNLMGCCRAGCTAVTSTTTQNFGACTDQASFSCQNGYYQLAPTSSTCGAAATCAAAPAGVFSNSVSLSFTCPGVAAVAASGHVNVDANGVSTQGGTPPAYQPVGSVSVGGNFNPLPKNRFYAVWSYGKDPAKAFKDAAGARAFDKNRFTDGTFGGTCTGPTGGTCTLVDTTLASTKVNLTTSLVTNTCAGATKCVADVNDAGWFYEYGDACPLQSCTPPPPWNDEKTGSAANVILGCTAWSGFRPFSSGTSSDPCSGTLGVPVSYGYLSNYVSGTPTPSCGYVSSTGGVYRAGGRVTTAPPSGGMVRVTVSPDGKVAYSTLSFDAGAPPGSKQLSVRSEIAEPVYWLEVSRTLHNCRHASAANCD